MRLGIIYYGTDAENRGLGQLSQCVRALGHEAIIITRSPVSVKAIRKFNDTFVIQIPQNQNKWSYFLSTPLPFNILWSKWIFDICRKYKLDGIFARETPLSFQILAVTRKIHIPVFLDLRENLAAAYEVGNRKKRLRRLLRQRILIKFYESRMVPRFTHIFTSTNELGHWLIEDYNIDPDSLSTMGNYPSKAFLDQAEAAIEGKIKSSCKRNEVLRLVHAGYILENRGIQDIIKALAILIRRRVKIVFKIIGEGPYLSELRGLVQRINLRNHVEFEPMLPPENVAKALIACDVGICAYLLSDQTHQTLPGKLFEYMAVGLPVLSSPRKTVIPIIENTECGLIYNSRKPEDISDIIITLANDRKMMKKMGENGRNAVLKHYNWRVNLHTIKGVLDRYTSEDSNILNN